MRRFFLQTFLSTLSCTLIFLPNVLTAQSNVCETEACLNGPRQAPTNVAAPVLLRGEKFIADELLPPTAPGDGLSYLINEYLLGNYGGRYAISEGQLSSLRSSTRFMLFAFYICMESVDHTARSLEESGEVEMYLNRYDIGRVSGLQERLLFYLARDLRNSTLINSGEFGMTPLALGTDYSFEQFFKSFWSGFYEAQCPWMVGLGNWWPRPFVSYYDASISE